MYQIQTLNKISPEGLHLFERGKYSYSTECDAPDAIMVRSADMHDTPLVPSVKAIARAGAGTNNIPVDACTNAGIVVFNTPGANANAVKELVIAGLLISARKIFPAMEWAQTLKGQGDEVPKLVEKGKSKFAGPELVGKSLGVVGLGAIGVQVANCAEHFGMNVYGYDPYLSVDTAWKLSHSVHHADSLKAIFENCDFISLHVPLTPETKGLINSESIAMMKHGVRILNFARGALVNDVDMLEALEEKSVRCYVTDFPSDALLGQPGVLAIPHLAASTPESEDNCARMAAEQLVDFLENGNIRNSVNLPDVVMNKNGCQRVGIIHRNIPAMIAGITNAFSDGGVNIENLTNRGKKDFAYTVVDAVGEIPLSVVEKVRQIEGVIRVNEYK